MVIMVGSAIWQGCVNASDSYRESVRGCYGWVSDSFFSKKWEISPRCSMIVSEVCFRLSNEPSAPKMRIGISHPSPLWNRHPWSVSPPEVRMGRSVSRAGTLQGLELFPREKSSSKTSWPMGSVFRNPWRVPAAAT